MALVKAQNMFLPPENIQKFNKEVTDFFLYKALKENDNEKLQLFCLDKAFGFMYDEENLTLAASWILNEEIIINGQRLNT